MMAYQINTTLLVNATYAPEWLIFLSNKKNNFLNFILKDVFCTLRDTIKSAENAGL